jgi:hypothetical protein
MRRRLNDWLTRLSASASAVARLYGTVDDSSSTEAIKYYDPRTWPASCTEDDVKKLLHGKLKNPAMPPHYDLIVAALRSSDADRLKKVQQLMRNVTLPNEMRCSLLEEAVISSLPFVNSGSLFAAHLDDQTQLEDIMRYLDDLESEGAPTVAQSKIMRPLCGGVPFLAMDSVKDDVRRHVLRREKDSASGQTALLCNIGCSGSGMTDLQHHTVAEAVRALRAMVHTQAASRAEQHRWRPLGFYVTFDRSFTSSHHDKYYSGSSMFVPPLTRIALRMVYSVLTFNAIDRGCAVDHDRHVPHYSLFALRLLHLCDLRADMSNFTCIIGALRKVLKWDGPMFIAIDGFSRAARDNRRYTDGGHTELTVTDCLRDLCADLLDAAQTLAISPKHGAPVVYERYISVNVRDAGDIAQLATTSRRPIIFQATPLLGLRHLSAAPNAWRHSEHRHAPPAEYTDLLQPQRACRGPVSPRQLLFLIHLSLASGNRRDLEKCLMTDAIKEIVLENDAPSYYIPSASSLYNSLFWTISSLGLLTQEVAASQIEKACLHATGMIVGASDVDIFSPDCALECRVFALEPELARRYTIVCASPTRLLVSPAFVRTVTENWPPQRSGAVLQHLVAFHAPLQRHVACAAQLLAAGREMLLRDPTPQVCKGLWARWQATNLVRCRDATLNAIFLHLACVLQSDGKGASGCCALGVLQRICSQIGAATGFDGTRIARGSLECIHVYNFPLCFVDAFSPADLERNHERVRAEREHLTALCHQEVGSDSNALNAVCSRDLYPGRNVCTNVGTASHELLQDALAAMKHFCFKPSNPNHQGDDGVVFLREQGAQERSWVVLLILNKHWFYEGGGSEQQREHGGAVMSVVDVWRSGVGPLPATMTDKHGAVHTLRYVRLLVTADAVEDDVFRRAAPPVDGQHRDLFAQANAAFKRLTPARRETVIEAATEWMTEELTTKPDDRECLEASTRARWLLANLGVEQSTLDAPKCGQVVAECHMDLDKITEWCPTVGLFAGNCAVMKRAVDGSVV